MICNIYVYIIHIIPLRKIFVIYRKNNTFRFVFSLKAAASSAIPSGLIPFCGIVISSKLPSI